MTETVTHAELRVDSCEAEVRVNDFSIMRLGGGRQSVESQPVPEYLIAGENLMEVLVYTEGGMFQARLVEFQLGAFTGSGGNDRIALSNGRERGTTQLAGDLARWAWQDCGQLTLSGQTVRDVVELVRSIHAAFVLRNPEPIVAASSIWNQELAIAYPERTAEYFSGQMAHDLVSDANHPAWRVAPLVESEFALRLCAGGRLVECVDVNGLPLVRSYLGMVPDFLLGMRVGFYQGCYRILR